MNSISVVIPAYNSARVIGPTLESVLAQTEPADEILVTDDGSTDETADVVRSFAPAVTLRQQPNRGTSAARQASIKAAKGEWVALLDSDDLWHPRYLEFQRRALRHSEGCAVLFSSFRNLAEDVDPGPWWEPVEGPIERIGGLEFCERYMEASGIILPSFSLIRREFVARPDAVVMPPEISGCEDLYLWYDISRFGSFLRTPSELGHYRLLDTSQSNDRMKSYQTRLPVFERLLDLYESETGPERRELIARHFNSARRQAARYLFGGGEVEAARALLHETINGGHDLKSLLILAMSYVPSPLRPNWPERYRVRPKERVTT